MFLYRFLVCLGTLQGSKIMLPSRRNANFDKIDVYKKYSKKSPKTEPFGGQKNQQNRSRLKKCESTLRAAMKAPRPQLNPSPPQRTPPRKSSPKGVLQVIHLSKYLISTSPSIHPSIHPSINQVSL
mgnify:CR=1 FL=1